MRPSAILVRALFVAILMLCSSSAFAQFKLGFVDSDVIVQSLPEFKTVEAKLADHRKSFEDTLRAIQSQFQQEFDSYQKQQATMTAETKAQKEAALANMRDQFMQYQQERLGAQGTLFEIQAQLLQPIREKVRSAIEKVAEQEKISAVMESTMFMYIDKKNNSNITFKVLDYLSRENK